MIEHYTYKITDAVNNEYYIGVRTSKECSALKDNYMGSYCTWTPENEDGLKKEILGIYPTRAVANSKERQRLIEELKIFKNEKCMNAHIPNIGYHMYGKSHTKKVRRNISKALKGRILSKKSIIKSARAKYIKINQYDLEGNFIKTWNSVKEVCNEMNLNQSNISHCLTNSYHKKSCGGYQWKYYNGDVKNISSIKYNRTNKEIVQLDNNGNFIRQWSSQTKAAKELDIQRSGISMCLNNKLESSGGFRWRWK